MCVCLIALVNKGNCVFAQGEYEKAKDFYQEAYNVEASCTEALYNLGKTNLGIIIYQHTNKNLPLPVLERVLSTNQLVSLSFVLSNIVENLCPLKKCQSVSMMYCFSSFVCLFVCLFS